MPLYGRPPAPPSNHWSSVHHRRLARSVPQLSVKGSVFGFLSRELHLCGGVAVHLCSVPSFLLLRTDVLVWLCHGSRSHLCDLYLVVSWFGLSGIKLLQGCVQVVFVLVIINSFQAMRQMCIGPSEEAAGFSL